MNEDIPTVIDTSVSKAIELYVNGGIRKLHEMLEHQNEKQEQFNVKVNNHMEVEEVFKDRVLPIIEAYEASERALDDARHSGLFILWCAGFITAVGGAWLVLREIFFK